MSSYFGYETGYWWVGALAYLGTFGVPALIGSLWIPDLIAKYQARTSARGGA